MMISDEYRLCTEIIVILKEVEGGLKKINQSLELLTNPVFVYDPVTGESRPMQRPSYPGAVFPICKCGGLVEEKRDDT